MADVTATVPIKLVIPNPPLAEPPNELTKPAAAPCQKFPPRIAENEPCVRACAPARASSFKGLNAELTPIGPN